MAPKQKLASVQWLSSGSIAEPALTQKSGVVVTLIRQRVRPTRLCWATVLYMVPATRARTTAIDRGPIGI
jgi:hypothetical protein